MYVKQIWGQHLTQGNCSLNKSFCHMMLIMMIAIDPLEWVWSRGTGKLHVSNSFPLCIPVVLIGTESDDPPRDEMGKSSESWMNLSLRSNRARTAVGVGTMQLGFLMYSSLLSSLPYWILNAWLHWIEVFQDNDLDKHSTDEKDSFIAFSRTTLSIVCSVSLL